LSSIPDAVKNACSTLLKEAVVASSSLSGGDIHYALKLKTESGKDFFVKWNHAPKAADMFVTEAKGLALLAEPGHIHVPNVIGTGETEEGAFLIMDFIESGPLTPAFWNRFGVDLARLHQHSASRFGWDTDNFIGRLPQSNQQEDTWPAFYVLHRLEPQLKMAVDEGYFDGAMVRRFHILFSSLEKRLPEELPSLIHGDLWAGNFLPGKKETPWLIDPAPYFGHREMDLAMSRLFGGFDQAFYAAYHSAWPLEPGFSERLDLYQLYYLLVHVNLFGGHYPAQVKRILAKYV
jgi:protein-ribulosamine 3-kinase